MVQLGILEMQKLNTVQENRFRANLLIQATINLYCIYSNWFNNTLNFRLLGQYKHLQLLWKIKTLSDDNMRNQIYNKLRLALIEMNFEIYARHYILNYMGKDKHQQLLWKIRKLCRQYN